jgi:hypothetical protein
MADNLPPSSADVTEPGSLNLQEPSGPNRPVMGLLTVLILVGEDPGKDGKMKWKEICTC